MLGYPALHKVLRESSLVVTLDHDLFVLVVLAGHAFDGRIAAEHFLEVSGQVHHVITVCFDTAERGDVVPVRPIRLDSDRRYCSRAPLLA